LCPVKVLLHRKLRILQAGLPVPAASRPLTKLQALVDFPAGELR
jgi:hypothetical protein